MQIRSLQLVFLLASILATPGWSNEDNGETIPVADESYLRYEYGYQATPFDVQTDTFTQVSFLLCDHVMGPYSFFVDINRDASSASAASIRLNGRLLSKSEIVQLSKGQGIPLTLSHSNTLQVSFLQMPISYLSVTIQGAYKPDVVIQEKRINMATPSEPMVLPWGEIEIREKVTRPTNIRCALVKSPLVEHFLSCVHGENPLPRLLYREILFIESSISFAARLQRNASTSMSAAKKMALLAVFFEDYGNGWKFERLAINNNCPDENAVCADVQRKHYSVLGPDLIKTLRVALVE
jgi:hypothetical protein